jgi:DNA modification methylase
MNKKIKIIQGNCVDKIKELEDNSIDCVVSSPPYFGLRDYGTASYEGGDDNCKHTITDGVVDNKNNKLIERPNRASDKKHCVKCGAKRIDEQFGLEKTYQDYLANTVKVFETFKPKLKDTATIWWNVGDSYNNKPSGNKDLKKSSGLPNKKENLHKRKDNISKVLLKSLKEKDLIMIPNRVAIALQDAGWYIRSEIIWHKPNPMPESVRDRPTSCHEKIWLITKSKKYYYDHEAIKEPITDTTAIRLLQKNIDNQKGSLRGNGGMKSNGNMKAVGRKKFDKNMGGSGTSFVDHSGYKKADGSYMINPTRNKRNVWTITTKPFRDAHFATFPKDLIEPCIKAGCPENGTVLDPFGGSGTTGIVAALNNRNAILIELNQDYIDIANRRISKEVGLFNG